MTPTTPPLPPPAEGPAKACTILRGQPVLLEYAELRDQPPNGDPSSPIAAKIQQAFGTADSLGMCLNLTTLRERLLRLASVFAALPEEVQKRVEHPESSYLFGWSCGKERMRGKPDMAKGSYYNNPLREEGSDDPEYRRQHPCYAYPNLWPEEHLPDLRPAFLEAGSLIAQVGMLLGTHCDAYLAKRSPALAHFFRDALVPSRTHKARLLHYFPQEQVSQEVGAGVMDSWCGAHVDSSILTGLLAGAYMDERDPAFPEVQLPPGAASGLYVQKGPHTYYKVDIPPDCIAFQLGEAAEIASCGWLLATAHLVRGMPSGEDPAPRHLARNSFAVFLQPDVDYPLREDYSFNDYSKDVTRRHYGL